MADNGDLNEIQLILVDAHENLEKEKEKKLFELADKKFFREFSHSNEDSFFAEFNDYPELNKKKSNSLNLISNNERTSYIPSAVSANVPGRQAVAGVKPEKATSNNSIESDE